jgi:UPF0755 protein
VARKANPVDTTENIRREVRAVRRVFTVIAWFWGLAGVFAVGAAIIALTIYIRATYDGKPGLTQDFEVPRGASGAQIAKLLEEQGFIDHEALFRIALRLHPVGGAGIKHGIYHLPQGYSAKQLLEELRVGPDRVSLEEQFRLTIPEGLSIPQAAALFDDPEAFIAAASDATLVDRIGVDAENLEGFLMPNTYFFDRKPDEKEAVTRMVEQFLEDYARLLKDIPAASQYDMKTVVTVASLVEEEARLDDERPVVASVIYNRMKSRMPLQMDSTLQFALNKYGERMLDVDKQVNSPYNTYKYPGLPPGPISSPGLASLRAAMQPANTDYLYFVSNADGKSHTFSRTLAEHNAAVARYNREMRGQRAAERATTAPGS